MLEKDKGKLALLPFTGDLYCIGPTLGPLCIGPLLPFLLLHSLQL